MNHRIKEIRKNLNLSQEEFAARLGITGSGLSNIENGKRKLTEQMILSICREFNIDENWLRTGEGGEEAMFIESNDSIIEKISSELPLDELSKVILKTYVEMDTKKRSAFNSFVKELASNIMQENKEKAISGVNEAILTSSIPDSIKQDLYGKVSMVFVEAFPYIGFGNIDEETQLLISGQAQKKKFMQMAEDQYNEEKTPELQASSVKESDVG